MKEKREIMSKQERVLLQANRRLVEHQKIYVRDIMNLIKYIKGDKELKNEVETLINYYEGKYLVFK